jgi:archaeal flagellar protein FlaI
MATVIENLKLEQDKTAPESVAAGVDLQSGLTEPLKTIAGENPHLMEYLKSLPISKIGVPEYIPEVTRKTGENKRPNLIYPVKRNNVFVHILFDANGERNQYIPIEAALKETLGDLMLNVEKKLLSIGKRLKPLDPELDLEKQFLAYLDLVVTQADNHDGGLLESTLGFLRKDGTRIPKIRVDARQFNGIRYLFIREKIGLGVLDPLIADPYIEDISCSGLGKVFVEHKIFKSLESTVNFTNYDELDEFVLWLAERIKKPVTYKKPISDATLPDGSRINIVFGRDLSKRGSNFSIRKFNEVPLSIFEILESGTINYQMLAYLSLAIGNGMNVFVSGETASGKTTLLNALTTFIPPMAKVITIEDTPELQVPHANWIREVVQSSKVEDTSGAITMFDLLRSALRQRPDEIMVGEIRGREGNIAFQAMQTGHSVMATFHAASVEKLIQRITGDPILVPKNYVDNLNVVILTSQVKLPNGRTGRRLTGISEIVSYDPALDSFSFVESFKWNQETDVFEFTGYMTSYVLENKIAPKLGIPEHKKRQIYAELERRSKILAKLHKEKGVRGFYEVLDVLNRAQQEGLF